MAVRRSTRARSNNSQTSGPEKNILGIRNHNIKRKPSTLQLPMAKRPRLHPVNSPVKQVASSFMRTKRGQNCAINDVVLAVLSDSPVSKYDSDEEEDVEKRIEVDVAKKNLFDTKTVTPKKVEKETTQDTPKSAGKFFKNRTPQKSKVLAARSKSISLIKQTCLGQKLKPKVKTDVKGRYNSLKFTRESVEEEKKENIVVEEDFELVMSDENSVHESECNSLVSGPVLPSPILPSNLTLKIQVEQSKHDDMHSSCTDDSQTFSSESSMDSLLSKSSSLPILKLQKLPEKVLTERCQILAGSIRTRSAGSSPALTRSRSTSRSPAITGRLAKSPVSKDSFVEFPSSRNDQNIGQNKGDKFDDNSQQSSGSYGSASIISSSQPAKASQKKVREILDGFMNGEEFKFSPKKQPKSLRNSLDKEQGPTRQSPRKRPVGGASPSKRCVGGSSPAHGEMYSPVKSVPSPVCPVFTRSPAQSVDSPVALAKKAKIISDKRHPGLEQAALDLGQKNLGTTQCKTCLMVYSQKDPDDEKSHVAFHERLLSAVRFPKEWKNERIGQQFPDGSRIIIVLPEDKRSAQKKIQQIQEVVDMDLGFHEASERPKYMKQTYLYISASKRVVGFCVAEAITSAYPVLSQSQRNDNGGGEKPWCCSTEPVIAKCGISRVWVLSEARRMGVATRLMDCVRCRFFMGVPLKTSDLAFTDPTPLGRVFAAAYCGTDKFLVYK